MYPVSYAQVTCATPTRFLGLLAFKKENEKKKKILSASGCCSRPSKRVAALGGCGIFAALQDEQNGKTLAAGWLHTRGGGDLEGWRRERWQGRTRQERGTTGGTARCESTSLCSPQLVGSARHSVGRWSSLVVVGCRRLSSPSPSPSPLKRAALLGSGGAPHAVQFRVV
ncbi:hypothetical protein L209DRAFT_561833 [Thermothelomyces heterothallicus CBS 203.75]